MIRHYGVVSTLPDRSAPASGSASASTSEAPRPSYRSVLATPGVLRLVILSTLGRIPQTAAGVAVTLHVARTLDAGYATAGIVMAATTIGMTLGGPWRGRVVDRAGLRRALLPSIVVGGAAWFAAPFLNPIGLIIAGLIGGVLTLPVFTVTRQSLAILVPEEQRRVVYSIDSIGTEVSFMVGPALGVLIATQWSSQAALLLVGLATVAAGLAFWLVNPPTRSAGADDSPAGAVTLNRRDWFTPTLGVILGVSGAATIVLSATDVSIVAVLDDTGRVGFAGLVIVMWSLGSLVGVAVYGALHRSVSPLWLLFALAVLTLPAFFAHSVLWLAVALFVAGALCAPTIASTTEAVARLTPERARGEAMGWHGSALTVGTAVGAPLAGSVIDGIGPSVGFVMAGGVGMAIAGAGLSIQAARRWRRRGLARQVPAELVEAVRVPVDCS
jgi:MFS family permease